MKRFIGIAGWVLSFCVGALVRLPHVTAQTSAPQPKRMYYEVDYMKSRPGQDPYKLEHDLWGPINKERIRNGEIASWAMMSPVFAGAHNYDYITVTGFHSLKDVEDTNYEALFNKVWGKEKAQTVMKQTTDTRDMLGSEIYIVTDSIEPPSK